MKLFMLKSLIIVSLMFVSVLFGMQNANDGIHKMKGYDDPQFKSAIEFSQEDDGSLKSAILGNDLSSHDLEQKRKKLEEMKAFNLFSTLGRKLADGISNVMEKTVDFITDKD